MGNRCAGCFEAYSMNKANQIKGSITTEQNKAIERMEDMLQDSVMREQDIEKELGRLRPSMKSKNRRTVASAKRTAKRLMTDLRMQRSRTDKLTQQIAARKQQFATQTDIFHDLEDMKTDEKVTKNLKRLGVSTNTIERQVDRRADMADDMQEMAGALADSNPWAQVVEMGDEDLDDALEEFMADYVEEEETEDTGDANTDLLAMPRVPQRRITEALAGNPDERQPLILDIS